MKRRTFSVIAGIVAAGLVSAYACINSAPLSQCGTPGTTGSLTITCPDGGGPYVIGCNIVDCQYHFDVVDDPDGVKDNKLTIGTCKCELTYINPCTGQSDDQWKDHKPVVNQIVPNGNDCPTGG